MNWDMMAGRWPTDGLRARVFNFNLYCGCDGGVYRGRHPDKFFALLLLLPNFAEDKMHFCVTR